MGNGKEKQRLRKIVFLFLVCEISLLRAGIMMRLVGPHPKEQKSRVARMSIKCWIWVVSTTLESMEFVPIFLQIDAPYLVGGFNPSEKH